MNQPSADRSDWAKRRAAALRETYGHLDGIDLLRVMINQEFRGRVGLVSSFGAESSVLIDLVAQVDPATPVIFLDTGKLFDETLKHQRRLADRLGLVDVRVVCPRACEIAAEDGDGTLWMRDPDACCRLRKTQPLRRALLEFDAWITGCKRFQGGVRSDLSTIESVGGWVKINPLARWSRTRIREIMRIRDLPPHPLVAEGYPSIGCQPCTRPAAATAPIRSGRWANRDKTECGIHLVSEY